MKKYKREEFFVHQVYILEKFSIYVYLSISLVLFFLIWFIISSVCYVPFIICETFPEPTKFLNLQLTTIHRLWPFFMVTNFQERSLNAHKRLGTVNGMKRFILYMINCTNRLKRTRSRFKNKRIAAVETCFLLITI